MNNIYTIGYSSFSIEEFINILRHYHIDAIADVRTLPYSQRNFDFNKDVLSQKLKRHKIYYVPLGLECGARPENASCYVDNKVSFEILSSTDLFRHGIVRLRNGMDKCTIGIMCAEQEPISCHRYILVARELLKSYPGIALFNILHNGEIEKSNDTDLRLMHLYNLDTEEIVGLGKSFDERLNEAFLRQARKISFQRDPSFHKNNLS